MNGIFLRSGYLDSPRVANLSPMAERFYVHLLLVTPDSGVFEVDYMILKNRCFPKLDEIRAVDIRDWLQECIDSDLIRIEKVSGQKFIIRVLRNQRREKPADTVAKNDMQTGTCLSFREFWDMYGKKVDRRKSESRYAKVTEADRRRIKEVLPAYVAATSDVKFRKNPATWLNNRCWEDDISSIAAMSEHHVDRRAEGF